MSISVTKFESSRHVKFLLIVCTVNSKLVNQIEQSLPDNKVNTFFLVQILFFTFFILMHSFFLWVEN